MNPRVGCPGATAVATRPGPVAGQNHNRGRRALEQRLLLTVNGTIPADDVEVSCHQRERFCVAPFAASKLGNRILIAGVAGEMEAPQPP